MKKLIVFGGLAALLIGSIFIVPAAVAAGPWSRGNAVSDTTDAWGGRGVANGAAVGPQVQRIATFLGLTQEDIKAQLQGGKTLAQIAEAKNITRQALIDFILAPAKDMLQLRVKYSYLTQAQADEAFKAQLERVNTFIDRVHTCTQDGNVGNGPGNGLALGRATAPGQAGKAVPPGQAGKGRGAMNGGGMMGGYGRTK